MQVRKPFIALLSLVVVATAIELSAARALGPRFVRGVVPRLGWHDAGVREPHRGWAGRPNLRAELVGPHAPYFVEHDARGYRQPERSWDKPPGVKRVLVLGDSLVYGWGVARAERFSDQLERALVERGLAVEVWNLGIPGYSVDQYLWTYELHGRALAPDVVIACLVMNDVPIAEASNFRGLAKPRFVRTEAGWQREEPPSELVRARALPRGVAWSAHSATLAWLRERREGPLPGPPTAPPTMPWDEVGSRAVAAATAAQAARFVAADAPVHEALRRLVAAVQGAGVPLVLTSFPFGHDLYLTDPRFEPPPEGRQEGPLARVLAAYAAEVQASAVSVDVALGEAVSAGAVLHVGDGHPNAQAHALLGKALAATVGELLAR